jgi:hypothetical protein
MTVSENVRLSINHLLERFDAYAFERNQELFALAPTLAQIMADNRFDRGGYRIAIDGWADARILQGSEVCPLKNRQGDPFESTPTNRVLFWNGENTMPGNTRLSHRIPARQLMRIAASPKAPTVGALTPERRTAASLQSCSRAVVQTP